MGNFFLVIVMIFKRLFELLGLLGFGEMNNKGVFDSLFIKFMR